MTFIKTKTGIALVVLIALFAFLYFFTGVFGGTFIGLTLRSNPDLENGLVAHYTFDGNTIDVSSTTAEVADASGNDNKGNFIGEAFGEMLWATTTDPSSDEEPAVAITTDFAGYVYVTGDCADPMFGDCNTGGGSAFYTYKIDPASGDMLWATTTDPSTGGDGPTAIATDPNGNVYVTGACATGCGSAGASAHYTFKIDPANGDMLWATTTDPSTSSDYAKSITTDPSGYVYVTGYGQNIPGCGACTYTYKIDPDNGDMIWATTTEAGGIAITTDPSGFVYVTGSSNSAWCSSSCHYTYKIDPANGDMIWATTTDLSTGSDYARAITTDPSGFVYVTGDGLSNEECILACHYTYKIDPSNGDMIWATTTDPTSGTDTASAIATDGSSNVYVTGLCVGCGSAGSWAHYTYKIDGANGDMLWATTTDPSTGFDAAYGIATDSSGNVYVTGSCWTGCASHYTYKIRADTIINDAVTSGNIGQGLEFDGVDDYLKIPTISFSDGDDWTLAAWMYDYQPQGVYGSWIGKIGVSHYFYIGSGNDYSYRKPNGSTVIYMNDKDPYENRWVHHVYRTNSDKDIEVFFDGEYITTISVGDSSFILESIGRAYFTNRNEAKVKVDDVRMYNRSLSTSSIERIYDLGATTKIAKTLDSNPDLKDGLVLHYTFDGADIDISSPSAEILDRSPSGNNGDWENHGTTTQSGVIGQALYFDGVDDHIDTNSSVLSGSSGNTWSVSFWAQIFNNSVARIIGEPGDNDNSLTLDPSVNDFEVLDDAYQPLITVNGLTDFESWHHYSVSRNGDVFTFYVDGEFRSSNSDSGIFDWSQAGSNRIGRQTVSKEILGGLDDFRVYDRTLSASEISRLYELGATTKIAKTIDTNPDLENGLVGHWTFDGPDMDLASNTAEVLDSSGNSYDGNWIDHATTTKSGVIGQALELDGSDDGITTKALPSFGGGDMTIAAWLKPDSAGSGIRHMISAKYVGGAREYTFDITTGNLFQFSIYNGCGSGGNGPTVPVDFDEWQFVVGRYSATDQTAYISKNITATNSLGSITSIPDCGADPIDIGYRNQSGGEHFFNGLIDDLRLYNRFLSDEEILRLYQLGQ